MALPTGFQSPTSAQRSRRSLRSLCLLTLPTVLALSCAAPVGTATDSSPPPAPGPPRSSGDEDSLRISCPPPSHPSPPPLNITPSWEAFAVCQDPETRSIQISGAAVGNATWKGWGTSLAWFANYIGGLPREHLNLLLDLIFDGRGGLGLNIARYNIGGGYNPNISTQFNESGPYGFRGMPGFRPAEDGPYDWSADARQRAVLLGARDRGADTFLAFSNSPPWWMTNSGDVAGADIPYTSNMNPRYYAAFAEYLTEVVRRYATDPGWNITFASLEPFNEVRESPWSRGFNQEGCHMSIGDITALIPLVAGALAAKGLSTQLVGIDSWTPFTASVLAQLPPVVSSLLTQIHVHGYTLPDLDSPLHGATVEAIYGISRAVGEATKREVWMSEWGPFQRYGGYLDLAMFMARSIVESVNILRAVSWTHWQVIDPTPAAWTLIDIPGEWNYSAPFSVSVNTQFWVLKHFSNQVCPGSVPVTVPTAGGCHHAVTAFYDAKKSTVTVFVVNQQPFQDSLELVLSGFAAAPTQGREARVRIKAYRTSFAENIRLLLSETRGRVPGTIHVDLAPRSLTSIVLCGVRIAT